MVSVQGRPIVLGFWEAVCKLDRSVCWSVRFLSIDRTDRLIGSFAPCEQTYTELGDPPEAYPFWSGPVDQKKADRKRRVRRMPRKPEGSDGDTTPPAFALEDGDAASGDREVDVDDLLGPDSEGSSEGDSLAGSDGGGLPSEPVDDDLFADLWRIFEEPAAGERAGGPDEDEHDSGVAAMHPPGSSGSEGNTDLEDDTNEVASASAAPSGPADALALALAEVGAGAAAELPPPGPEPAEMAHIVPVFTELMDGQIIRADLAVGRVTAYRTTCTMVAECNMPGHGKCHLTRKMKAGPRPGQGRPLGLLLDWLHDPAIHLESRGGGQGWPRPTFEERAACRITIAAVPGAEALLDCERGSFPDEGDEPPYVA